MLAEGEGGRLWWEKGKSEEGGEKRVITAERLLKRPDKCAVETDTHGRTWLAYGEGSARSVRSFRMQRKECRKEQDQEQDQEQELKQARQQDQEKEPKQAGAHKCGVDEQTPGGARCRTNDSKTQDTHTHTRSHQPTHTHGKELGSQANSKRKTTRRRSERHCNKNNKATGKA